MQTKQMGRYVKKTVARKNWLRLAARGSGSQARTLATLNPR